jgi:predicted ArsR family transcriptional regulator
VVNASHVARSLRVSTRSARNGLDRLTENGVLTLVGGALRDRLWQAPAVLAAMDAFAAQSGRRVAG